MTDQQSMIKTFLAAVKASQTLWALKEPESDDFVVLDSINFEKFI